jgi:hypothetical protein
MVDKKVVMLADETALRMADPTADTTVGNWAGY